MATKPFPLSDEEYINQCINDVKGFAKNYVFSSMDIPKCLNFASKRIGEIWKSVRGYWYHTTITDKDELEMMDRTYNRINPIVREKSEAVCAVVLKNRTLKAIKAASAEAVLSQIVSSHGYQYAVDAKEYKLNVLILLHNNKTMKFNLMYKDVNSGKAQAYIENIMEVAELIDSKELDFTIETPKYMITWK